MSIENLLDAGFRGRALVVVTMPPKSSGTPLLQAWQVPYVVDTQNVLPFHVSRNLRVSSSSRSARPIDCKSPIIVPVFFAPLVHQFGQWSLVILRRAVDRILSINKVARYLLRLPYLTSCTHPHDPMHTQAHRSCTQCLDASSAYSPIPLRRRPSHSSHFDAENNTSTPSSSPLSSLARVPVSW